MALSVCFIFTVTIGTFPAVTVDVKSKVADGGAWGESVFSSVKKKKPADCHVFVSVQTFIPKQTISQDFTSTSDTLGSDMLVRIILV